jgi:hypothetical protein
MKNKNEEYKSRIKPEKNPRIGERRPAGPLSFCGDGRAL